MSIKLMIIDEQADFRSLLMHHVTTHWPDAIISAYDPVAAGQLPNDFGGAGNDIILLGSMQGEERDGVDVLAHFVQRRDFPPIVYFGTEDDEQLASDLHPSGHFMRDQIGHDSLISGLSELLLAKERIAPTEDVIASDLESDEQRVISGYRLLRTLGSTEYSGVYLAERDSTQGQVVLKVLRQAPEHADNSVAFDRFLREYETIAEMDHPNIVKIYDLGIGDDHAHIVMEYIDGGDLRRKIESGVSEHEGVQYLRQIANALCAVHDKNVLHRDLKPGNIMVRDDGSIALIDFGLAKQAKLESAITDKGTIFGTPYYMSPEQGHGVALDERSDIYSLGVIFFELLTGDKPFKADTAMGTIYQHAKAPVPRLPQKLAGYQVLINRMLAKRPEDRLQSAAEIGEWL